MRESVTIAEIDEQRERGWPDFHPEDYCHRCGGRNVSSWWVDSDRFNMAFGTEHPYNGIVCPGCFVEAHEEATGLTTTWVLVPDPRVPFRHRDDPGLVDRGERMRDEPGTHECHEWWLGPGDSGWRCACGKPAPVEVTGESA